MERTPIRRIGMVTHHWTWSKKEIKMWLICSEVGAHLCDLTNIRSEFPFLDALLQQNWSCSAGIIKLCRFSCPHWRDVVERAVIFESVLNKEILIRMIYIDFSSEPRIELRVIYKVMQHDCYSFFVCFNFPSPEQTKGNNVKKKFFLYILCVSVTHQQFSEVGCAI